MPNTFTSNPQLLIREPLRYAHQASMLTKYAYRGAEEYLGEASVTNGWKGQRIVNIKAPQQFKPVKATALDTQYISDNVIPITVATQTQVGLTLSAQEMTMDVLNSRLSEIVFKPAALSIVASIETDGFNEFIPNIYNFVGTPTVAVTKTTLLAAKTRLTNCLCPAAGRVGMVSPEISASIVDGFSGLYNPTGAISSQYKTGDVGDSIYNINWNETTLTTAHTCGTRVASGSDTKVKVTTTLGATLRIYLSSAGSSLTITTGDRFTVAGVYAVHPETKKNMGYIFAH